MRVILLKIVKYLTQRENTFLGFILSELDIEKVRLIIKVLLMVQSYCMGQSHIFRNFSSNIAKT